MGARSQARALRGRRAEALVVLVSTLDRAALDREVRGLRRLPASLSLPAIHGERRIVVSHADFRALLLLEAANTAEQSRDSFGRPVPWMAKVLRWHDLVQAGLSVARFKQGTLTETSDRTSVLVYGATVDSADAERADAWDEVVFHNPLAGEPRILRALCHATLGETGKALEDAALGATLLSDWGTPWVKQMSLASWLMLAERVRSVAAGPRPNSTARAELRSTLRQLRSPDRRLQRRLNGHRHAGAGIRA